MVLAALCFGLVIISEMLSSYGVDTTWAYHFTGSVVPLMIFEFTAETIWFFVTETSD
jgi:hypothetical protein